MNIKDYLHLYGIDCDIMTPDGLGSILVIHPKVVEVSINIVAYKQVMKGRKGGGEMHYKYFYETDDLKLCLRPLSDMSDEEDKECSNIMFGEFAAKVKQQNIIHYEGEKIKYLLSKHFDLFGLIEAGLAIDKTTCKQNQQ